MNVFIIGANGFIGSHLVNAILEKKSWRMIALDIACDKLIDYLDHPRLHFRLGDMNEQLDWISDQIKQCDVVLPLAAIATPAAYVKNPLSVFELDFEANLKIIRLCAKWHKRIVFPSTSEVYGMCRDAAFDEELSECITGPIQKERWIYATSKQLLDRIIYAYGKRDELDYTLFRPFNWYGPGLDAIQNPNGSRVLTQFIGNVLRGDDIALVNGGLQQRCFTYIDDGIAALLAIIENHNHQATQRIFNIGNPDENISIATLANKVIAALSLIPAYQERASRVRCVTVDAADYYGAGYQDLMMRVPSIKRAMHYLGWQPHGSLDEGLKRTIAYYSAQATCSSTTDS
jgi:nucleoside-diphosphate-sugar epimerase